MTKSELKKENENLKIELEHTTNEREALLDEIVPKRKRVRVLEKELEEAKREIEKWDYKYHHQFEYVPNEKYKAIQKELENSKSDLKFVVNARVHEERRLKNKIEKYKTQVEAYENALKIIAGGKK